MSIAIKLPQCFFAVAVLSISIANADESKGATEKNEEKPRRIVLFDFKSAQSGRSWQAVNDGVMGGRSQGSFRITDEGYLEFFGNLSLANNGGFASIRSRGQSVGLREGDELVVKVKGDGRKYTFNLYTPDRRTAFSYRVEFETLNNQWSQSKMPLDRFVATSFGRQMPSMRLVPERVTGVGILLGDKKPGPFRLLIESITIVCHS